MKEQLVVTLSGEDYERLVEKSSDLGCTPNQLIHRVVRCSVRERNICDNPFINKFLELCRQGREIVA